jgi:hypothetical protein
MLTARLPGKDLTFRNMGWSADAVDVRPRPLNFGPMKSHLKYWKADVLVACFGMPESFEGEKRRERFRDRLDAYIADRTSTGFNGASPARLVLVSPIAHEDLGGRLPEPTQHNEDLKRYTRTMREVAEKHGVPFIDLFTPTRRWHERNSEKSLTFNGIHLTRYGDWVVAGMLMKGLGYDPGEPAGETGARKKLESLRSAIAEKNELFFHRWRAVNAEYIYGRRREPFGVEHFPEEMDKLERLTDEQDQQIHQLAEDLPAGAVRPPAPRHLGRLIGVPE